jgi:hypothetical protein
VGPAVLNETRQSVERRQYALVDCYRMADQPLGVERA